MRDLPVGVVEKAVKAHQRWIRQVGRSSGAPGFLPEVRGRTSCDIVGETSPRFPGGMLRGSLARMTLPARPSSTRRATRGWALGASLLAGLLCVVPVAAEALPSAADREVSARLAFVVGVLERDEPRMRFWFDSWTSGFAALAVAQTGVALGMDDRSTRISAVSGAIKAAIGVAGMLARPPIARTAATTLRAMGEGSAEERRRKLVQAESLLHESADQEQSRRGWPALLGAALINLAGAYVLWAGYHEDRAGWIGFGGGVVVAQVQLWTQPKGASAAWSAYARGRYLGPPPPAPSMFSWSLLPSPSGLALGGSF
jgi:hypothetical protein